MSLLQIVGAALLIMGTAMSVFGVRQEAVSPTKGTPQQQQTWLLGIGVLIALVGAYCLVSPAPNCPTEGHLCL